MLFISLPLSILAALAGWDLVGSVTLFCSSFVQCNPLSKEVSSIPRTDDWDVPAVTKEQHLHITLSSASSETPQGPTKAVDLLPRFHPCADPSLLSTTWATVGMSSEKHSLVLLELHFRLMKALFPRLENINPLGFPATASAIFRKP